MLKKKSEHAEKIGCRLRESRKVLGLNLVTFSEKLGISAGSVSDIENGKTTPSAETIINILRNTEIDVEWLLTGQGKAKAQNGRIFIDMKKWIDEIAKDDCDFANWFKFDFMRKYPEFVEWLKEERGIEE